MESESTWWKQLKGQGGDPGAVTAVLDDNRLSHPHVVGRRLLYTAA